MKIKYIKLLISQGSTLLYWFLYFKMSSTMFNELQKYGGILRDLADLITHNMEHFDVFSDYIHTHLLASDYLSIHLFPY